MTSQSHQWLQLAELVEEAKALEPASRRMFLDEACGVDTEVRREVESLLRYDGEVGEFLEAPDQSNVAFLIDKHRAERLIGKRIGRYEVVDVLGYGGMGVVYRAKQDRTHRMVAVKVVRGEHFVDDRHTKLFEREIRTLARLKHRGIASIHEAGNTDDGRHYFAMELVDGMALDEFIRTKRPTREERLGLMRQICDAINYAHQRGVIHRDIKPSNILIDQEGQPKVLDFGLAKITDSDVTMTSLATEVGKIQGTLSYMSPEQARGRSEDIDLRSDVYSLGVLLYEMFAERLPYDLKGFSLPEVVRIITEDTPTKLSSTDRSLRGDIETIISKALEKDPDRRYQSAAAMAEDIDRYQSRQPILARPPSTSYVLRKLIARHKAPFVLFACIFLMLGIFSVWMSVLYRRADAEAARARSESRTAGRVIAMLTEMFESSDPARHRGATLTAREVLDRAARQLPEMDDEPGIQVPLAMTLAHVYSTIGLHSRSLELHQQAKLARARLGFSGDHQEALILVGEAMAFTELQRFEEAKTCFDQARAIYTKKGDMENVAKVLNGLAILSKRNNELDQADTYVQEALQLVRDAQRPNLLGTLADLHRIRGDFAIAEPLLREQVAMLRAGGERDGRLASAATNLAFNLQYQGRYLEVEALLREALEIRQEMFGNRHPIVAQSHQNLGTYLTDAVGDYAAAEGLIRLALEIYRKLPAYESALADCLQHLAVIRTRQGDLSEAAPLFEEAVSLERMLFGNRNLNLAETLRHYGSSLHMHGRYEAARPILMEVLEITESLLGSDHFEVLNVKVMLTACVDTQRAEQLRREIAAVTSDGNNPVAQADRLRGEAWGRRHTHPREASEQLRQALALQRRHLKNHPTIGSTLTMLGFVLMKIDRVVEAESCLREALAIREVALEEGHWLTAITRSLLGESLTVRGQYNRAEQLLTASYPPLAERLGEQDDRTQEVMERFVRLYEAWDADEPGEAYDAKAEKWRTKLRETEED